jgi:hypothetical protein
VNKLIFILALLITLGSGAEARRAGQIAAPPPPPRQLSRLQRFQQSILYRVAARTISALALLVGIVAGIDTLWGPFWPTTPDVTVGPPDQSAPFAVPFTLENRSIAFPIEGQFFCVLHRIVDTSKQPATLAEVPIIAMGPAALFTQDKEPFKCWFPFREHGQIMPIAEAHIEIMMIGRVWPWQSVRARSLGQFTWDAKANPPRWLPGSRIMGLPQPQPQP